MRLRSDFSGTLLDFGCGLGDSMAVYRSHFPEARLIGVDISEKAIEICRATYSHLAEFIQGDVHAVPVVDVIISSNVLEHLDNDIDVARRLLSRCAQLYVVVPYKEEICLNNEHVNSYDQRHFESLGVHEWYIIPSQQKWISLAYSIYCKNLLRAFSGRRLVRRPRQIMFCFQSKRR